MVSVKVLQNLTYLVLFLSVIIIGIQQISQIAPPVGVHRNKHAYCTNVNDVTFGKLSQVQGHAYTWGNLPDSFTLTTRVNQKRFIVPISTCCASDKLAAQYSHPEQDVLLETCL